MGAPVVVEPLWRHVRLPLVFVAVLTLFWLGRALCLTAQSAAFLVPYDLTGVGWRPRIR